MTKNVPLQVLVALIAILALMIFIRREPGLFEPPTLAQSQLLTGAQALKMRETYLDTCASCHGARGEGGTAQVDFSSAPAVASLSRSAMIRALDDRHGGRLAAPLGAKDAAELVDFVREYLMLPAPFEDASVGRRVYSESCSVCHGERGDGASWAQYSLNPPPRDFAAADPAGLTRADMVAAVTFGKPNTAMMPFATQLTPDEIAAAVDYIRIAFMTREPSTDKAAPQLRSGDGTQKKN